MLSQKDVYEQWALVNPRNKEPVLSGFRLCAELAGAPATDERPHNRMLSHRHSLSRRYRVGI